VCVTCLLLFLDESPAGGATADYPIKVLAEDGTTNSVSTIRLSTESNPGDTSSASNGGLTDGTAFNLTITATAAGGVSVKVVVYSDEFNTNMVTVNVPAAAAHVNATLWFQFLGGYNARLANTNGATIYTNPTLVMLPAAGSSTTYSIHVTNDRGDNDDYSVKVVVAPACVGVCAASTLMQLSLPLAILLFVFGRKAAEQ
jgi:hypothetical protein